MLPVIIILLLIETPLRPDTALGRGPTILQLCDPSVNISVEDSLLELPHPPVTR